MKKNVTSSIVIKFIVVVLFFTILGTHTNIFKSILGASYDDLINFNTAYPQQAIESMASNINVNQKESLIVGSVYIRHEIEEIQPDLPDDTINQPEIPNEVPENPSKEPDTSKEQQQPNPSPIPTQSKSIYIYNSHQAEEYTNGNVIQGSHYLAELLRAKGFVVIVEENDFIQYQKDHGLAYKDSYAVSRLYYQKAIEKYGQFDYVIDFHRDSISKDLTTYTDKNGENYAKLMFVAANMSDNYNYIVKQTTTLTTMLNEKENGICRSVYLQDSRYNQDLNKNSSLLEVGGVENTFEEVKNSLEVFSEILAEYLGGTL